MKPKRGKAQIKKLILKTDLSPGDILMLTAAVRDLHACYPHLFVTDVRTPCPELWENNPHIAPLREGDLEVEAIKCHVPLIDRSDSTPYHFLHGYIEFLNDRLGLNIRPTAFKGDIHLSDLERSWYSQVWELTQKESPFWIIDAGGKFDYTIKWWAASRYQEVIDHFRGRIQFVQVGALDHYHPKLKGVIDLRGKTDVRQLVRLVYHAQGVLCPVTFLMHLAAAVEVKPGRPPNRACVVIGGGREPWQWEAYPHHQYLHTIGALPCCAHGGCWRSRTLPLGDGTEHDEPSALCVDVVGQLPRCMHLITADEVVRSVERYFEGGSIKYLSASQAAAVQKGIEKTRANPFDEHVNVYTARTAVEAFIASIPPYPKKYAGQGIVICGGGLRSFPSVWVCLNMLRRLGCSLPVQIWHRGKKEVDDRMVALTSSLNAVWVDAEETRKAHPARALEGCELKAYALLHSPFREVLLLDADNVPVANPEPLFDTLPFKKTGAILWPELKHLKPNQAIWKRLGIGPRDAPGVDSGQMVIDKERCWAAVMLAWWYNDHSDYFYQFTEGDKLTYLMAFFKLRQVFAMPEKRPEPMTVGLCQHDFKGRRVFQHRYLDKWEFFHNNRRDPDFWYEDECFSYLRAIRAEWDKKLATDCLLIASPAPNRRHHGNGAIKRPPDLTLVTLHDAQFEEIAQVTVSRMREYAELHGYGFLHHRTLLDPARHPSWNKILAIRKAMRTRRSEWIVWIDADAVVMNYDCRVEDLVSEGRDLILGSDFNGINCAVMLVRNCDWSLRFLETVYNLGDLSYDFDHLGPKWEQNTIKHVLSNFGGFQEHVAVHPENRMNSSLANYQDGDFIMHLGALTMQERLKALTRLNVLKPQ
jgi:ADP-heptose:LPS heptosyltransferase